MKFKLQTPVFYEGKIGIVESYFPALEKYGVRFNNDRVRLLVENQLVEAGEPSPFQPTEVPTPAPSVDPNAQVPPVEPVQAPAPVAEAPEEEPLDPKDAKKYLGNNGSDAYFYLYTEMNEQGQPKDLQVLDANDEVKFSAVENKLDVNDVRAFLLAAGNAIELSNWAAEIVTDILLPQDVTPVNPEDVQKPMPTEKEADQAIANQEQNAGSTKPIQQESVTEKQEVAPNIEKSGGEYVVGWVENGKTRVKGFKYLHQAKAFQQDMKKKNESLSKLLSKFGLNEYLSKCPPELMCKLCGKEIPDFISSKYHNHCPDCWTAKQKATTEESVNESPWATDPYSRGDSVRALAAIRSQLGMLPNVRPMNTQYMTFSEGNSNKYHYFALFNYLEGKYIAANAYARMGYNPRVEVFAQGDLETVKAAYQKKIQDKQKNGYKLSEKVDELLEKFALEEAVVVSVPREVVSTMLEDYLVDELKFQAQLGATDNAVEYVTHDPHFTQNELNKLFTAEFGTRVASRISFIELDQQDRPTFEAKVNEAETKYWHARPEDEDLDKETFFVIRGTAGKKNGEERVWVREVDATGAYKGDLKSASVVYRSDLYPANESTFERQDLLAKFGLKEAISNFKIGDVVAIKQSGLANGDWKITSQQGEMVHLTNVDTGEKIKLHEIDFEKYNPKKISEATTWIDFGWPDFVPANITAYKVKEIKTGEIIGIKSADEKFVQLEDGREIRVGDDLGFKYKSFILLDPKGKPVNVNINMIERVEKSKQLQEAENKKSKFNHFQDAVQADAHLRQQYPEEPYTSTALVFADSHVHNPEHYGKIRKLDWAGIYTDANTFLKQAKIVGQYNEFSIEDANIVVDKFGNGAKYRLAREGSPSLYITVRDMEGLKPHSLDLLKDLTKASEVDLTNQPGEVRFHWN